MSKKIKYKKAVGADERMFHENYILYPYKSTHENGNRNSYRVDVNVRYASAL